MTTLHEYVHAQLDEPQSLDVIGLGAAEREYDNRWLYEMNRDFSRVEGLEEVNDYWLGFEGDERDYAIEGDVFQQDFSDDILDSEASLLVAPRPIIYRGAAIEDDSYTSNYVKFGELAKTDLDAVLMRQVGEDFQNVPDHLEYEDMAEHFREAFQKKALSMGEMNASDMASMVQNQPGISATYLDWATEEEEAILVTENQRTTSTL